MLMEEARSNHNEYGCPDSERQILFIVLEGSEKPGERKRSSKEREIE